MDVVGLGLVEKGEEWWILQTFGYYGPEILVGSGLGLYGSDF